MVSSKLPTSGLKGSTLVQIAQINLRKMMILRPSHCFRLRGIGLSAVLSIVASLLPPCTYASSNDEVEVRLKTPITSYRTKLGQPFECVVLRPWVSNGVVIIPQGAIVHGHLGHVTSVGLGLVHERAQMELLFDDFVTADGRTFPLKAQLLSVDNAREGLSKSGAIRGVVAANQPNELYFGWWHSPSFSMISRSLIGLTGISHQIASLFSLGPAGAGGLLALRLALFRFPEPEIQYSPGADIRLKVNAALQQGVQEAPVVPLPAPEGVAEWLRKEPFGVDRRDNRPVGDIVNLAFLGSRQQLEHSFSGAGWVKADPPTGKKKRQAYYAFNAMRAYANAPVSALFYKGMLPELVFEKSLNTVVKRHHIRVWYAGVVDGKELWLGAATHDVGGTFNPHYFRFTHKIDPNVDDERDKIVTDLRFAGCADPEMRVDRPTAASNGLDRDSITDGAASVLSLTDCEVSNAPPFVMDKPGNFVSRLARRLILEARNHVERENPYYWTVQLLMHERRHILPSLHQSQKSDN